MNHDLVQAIRNVLPRGTVGRYDLLPVFRDPVLLSRVVKALSVPFAEKTDYVASPEAIGWLLGISIARELNVGFVPLRKGGKLPYANNLLLTRSYSDYSGGQKTLEINKFSLPSGSRVLLVDEWIETAATARSCINLIERLGCSVIGIATIGIDNSAHTKEWIDSGFVSFIGTDI